MIIDEHWKAEQYRQALLAHLADRLIARGRVEDLFNPPIGSPWDYIFPPKGPDLWRSRGMSNRPSRPVYEEQSPSYRRAMINAGRGRLLP
jgi:hypothetical protein